MPRVGWPLLVCASAPREPARHGDEIVAHGRFVRTGTPVVLWLDEGGYAASAQHYGSRRGPVTQVVIHYDVCGTSCNCFRVLERRGPTCCQGGFAPFVTCLPEIGPDRM